MTPSAMSCEPTLLRLLAGKETEGPGLESLVGKQFRRWRTALKIGFVLSRASLPVRKLKVPGSILLPAWKLKARAWNFLPARSSRADVEIGHVTLSPATLNPTQNAAASAQPNRWPKSVCG